LIIQLQHVVKIFSLFLLAAILMFRQFAGRERKKLKK
jgi:hypothetical protein